MVQVQRGSLARIVVPFGLLEVGEMIWRMWTGGRTPWKCPDITFVVYFTYTPGRCPAKHKRSKKNEEGKTCREDNIPARHSFIGLQRTPPSSHGAAGHYDGLDMLSAVLPPLLDSTVAAIF